MSDQAQFSIGKVENIVQRSKEIGSNVSMVDGLINSVGGVHVTCPACNASAQVHMRLFHAP